MQFLCKPVTLWNVFIGISFGMRLSIVPRRTAHLLENVPFAPRFDGTVPSVVLELLLAVSHREPLCLA